MGFPGNLVSVFQALQFVCFLFPPIGFVFIEDWDVVYRDCFSGVDLVADMLTTFIAMWLHLFGPDREEKIANVFLFSVGFGLTGMSLFGYIVYSNQRALKYHDPIDEDGMDSRGIGNPELDETRLAQCRNEAKKWIIRLVLFVGCVGFVTFVLLYMKATAEDLPSAIYLGIIILILAELSKTIYSIWVRHGEFRRDTPVVFRMKQAQSLLFCFLSAVECLSPIPDELKTSISVQLLQIASGLVMILAAIQFACRWLYEPLKKIVDDFLHAHWE